MTSPRQQVNKEPAKVSVIMPAYNGEKYIAESIRSVLAQTYLDWEMIVVDDGSIDRTSEIARDFSSQDKRIIYVSQQNGGQGRARNTGIRMARGEVIAFLDQDDLWLKEKLELQLKAMKEANADVIFSDGFIFQDEDSADESTTCAAWFSALRGKVDGASMLGYLLTLNRIPTLSALVRRERIEGVGLFEEDRRYQNCDDYDLWLKLAESGAIFFGTSEKLVRYRLHSNQHSRDSSRMNKSEIGVLEKPWRLTPADQRIKEKRLSALRRELVVALINDGKANEAQEALREFRERAKSTPFSLFEQTLIKILPDRYTQICKQLDRVKDSLSYRVTRPMKSMYRRMVDSSPN